MMTKYKIGMFPIHPPFQSLLSKTGHEFCIVEGFNGVYWSQRKNPVLGSAARPKPENFTFVSYDDFLHGNLDLDLLLIQSPEHISTHGFNDKYLVGFSWHQIFDINKSNLKIIGQRPIAYETSTNMTIREQDRFVMMGYDPRDYQQRSYDDLDTYKNKLLFPINCFKRHSGILNGALTGYDWINVIKDNPMLTMCGWNPEYDGHCEEYNWDDYRYYLSNASAIFKPCPHKHRSNVIADAMCSNQVIITRPNVKYKNNNAFLEHGYNAHFVNTPQEFNSLLKDGEIALKKSYQKMIGENALLTIYEKWGTERMVNSWNNYFEYIIG